MFGPFYVQEKLREIELERAMARARPRLELRPPPDAAGPGAGRLRPSPSSPGRPAASYGASGVGWSPGRPLAAG